MSLRDLKYQIQSSRLNRPKVIVLTDLPSAYVSPDDDLGPIRRRQNASFQMEYAHNLNDQLDDDDIIDDDYSDDDYEFDDSGSGKRVLYLNGQREDELDGPEYDENFDDCDDYRY